MTTLRDVRKRLHSVENIKQITKAMEMVAAAQLRRVQIKAEEAQPYVSHIHQLLTDIATNAGDISHPLLEERKVKKTGIIVVTSDKGLCGSYNSNIISYVDKFLAHFSPNQVELILIGKKGVDHYLSKKWPIKHKVHEWGGKITFSQINDLAYLLMNSFFNGELDEIYVIYMHHINILSRKIVKEKFLNIEKIKSEEKKTKIDFIFEPNLEAILDDLLIRYCSIKLQSVLDDAYTAELAARVISMKSATKNASEMIDNLTLTRNKIRQAGITKEMVEIISGSEGFK